MALVKICGVNSAEAFDAVVQAEADYIGFVFFPPSPRYVLPTVAAALSARASGGPARVGLFVNPDEDLIAAALADVRLDALQIYGPASLAAALRTRFSLPVWRAVGVSDPADLPTALDGADRLLIEARPPAGATRPGGNATALNWSMLARWRAPGLWLLAGGLTPDNVAAAIGASGAQAVDVSSGVETAPGVKSPTLIGKFVASARELRAVSAV